ncbi:MAG: D-alanyl-D-alanine carboxypeptidase [Solirubrobacterales bacterium]|nr:D-alanyl-D-alanine carboxypeptidase [Solirubrobacterales bacterium]
MSRLGGSGGGAIARRVVLISGLLLMAPSASALAAAVPKIDADAAIVVEASTGQVAYAKRPNQRLAIASTTKLMTALLTLERGGLNDLFTASAYKGEADESKLGLAAGEQMTVADLLRSLLLVSANDGAIDLASGVSGSVSAFVAAMNARAHQLGLRNTNYANPIGLDDPANYSTAADLAKLAIILRRNPLFRKIVDQESIRLQSGKQSRKITNTNDLLGVWPAVNGVKTGHTDAAGYVLVGSATQNGITVVSVVLGDPSKAARDADTLALLHYGLSQFRNVTPVQRGDHLATTKVKYRNEEKIALIASASVHRVVRRGAKVAVSVIGVPEQLQGPLAARTREATVVISISGRATARVALLTASAVPSIGIGERTLGFLLKPAPLAVIAVVLIGLVMLVRLIRNRRRRQKASESQLT